MRRRGMRRVGVEVGVGVGVRAKGGDSGCAYA
jgi:hypothetical protein